MKHIALILVKTKLCFYLHNVGNQILALNQLLIDL